MKNYFLLSFFIFLGFCVHSQEKKGVVKTDISSVPKYNFYQLAYEFNISEKSSMEIGIGFGSEASINIYGLSVQPRYYIHEAPKGFHFGPRVLAIYAESDRRNSTYFNSKENAFGFEIDGIIGYQFLIGNTVTLDPYLGGGFAIADNKTEAGFVWGLTLGIAF